MAFLRRSSLARSVIGTALATALCVPAMPASAAAMAHARPGASSAMPGWSIDQETAHRYRPYGSWGWGRGYRGWGHHHHDGLDGGDVLAGVLILGGIAAVASAASRDRDRSVETDPNGYPYRNDRNRDWEYRYRDRQGRDDYNGAGRSDRGLDNAADRCVNEVERTGSDRVDEVNSVDRDSRGWRVEGRLTNGRSFSCDIDNDGRVGSVDLGAASPQADEPGASPSDRAEAAPGQWDDQAYERARAAQDPAPAA